MCSLMCCRNFCTGNGKSICKQDVTWLPTSLYILSVQLDLDQVALAIPM